MYLSLNLIKYDVEVDLKYRHIAGSFIILILLFLNSDLFSQKNPESDTIYCTKPGDIYMIWYPGFLSSPGWPLNAPTKLIPPSLSYNDSDPLFFDSLRVKASRFLITKKLYDFVVVSNRPSSLHRIAGSSESDYINYSGKIIRKIEIKRLDVFGTDINNPLISNNSKIDNLLNKTHINTAEHIIRKNLLFREGDTLSPLLLSDNERMLRQLPYIEDSRIIVTYESGRYVDILVVTKDVYSLGGSFEIKSIGKGSFSVYDKNIFAIGHDLKLRVPYDTDSTGSPGIGLSYYITNISKSFIDLNLEYYNALGKKSYGFGIERQLVSSSTKYAGGINIFQTSTKEDLDTLPEPEPLKFNHQDYWLSRSFLLNPDKATRLIIGARYINNNVFRHPYILPDSYHSLQKYRIYLGSISLSSRKFYKANLIYGYGRTEDIPNGTLINITVGKEFNEFKERLYSGFSISAGSSLKRAGYLHGTAGLAAFSNKRETEQGILILRADYFTNLLYAGNFRMRNFFSIDFTRGFGRYKDEYLLFNTENGFAGFRNDSLRVEKQRFTMNLESVLFSPGKVYGFRFAWFAFGDLGYLFGTNEFFNQGEILSRIGIGLRLRNDNLVFNTLQIRVSYYPNLPKYSRISYFNVSGERLLDPDNFEPGPPSLLPYR